MTIDARNHLARSWAINTIITAQQYPRNMLPVSPMKIEAGLKLYGTNPSTAPSSASPRMTRSASQLVLSPPPYIARWTATNRKPAAMIAVTPPHRPSMPSSRLVALHHPMTARQTSNELEPQTSQLHQAGVMLKSNG